MSNNKNYATIWYKQAQYDLNAAEISLKSGSYEWAYYQSQQAAEKALKAFLYFNRKRDITIHSIKKLLEQCGTINKKFFNLREVKELDQYYIPTRNPNGLPGEVPYEFYSIEDAEKCVKYAKEVISLVGMELEIN